MKKYDKMICECRTSEHERQLGKVACGEKCLNRESMIECDKNCPCSEYCENKNFEGKKNANIQLFKTVSKGLGIKTNTELKP